MFLPSELVLGLIVVGFVLVSSIATWFALSRTGQLRRQLAEMERQLSVVTQALADAGIATSRAAQRPTAAAPPAETKGQDAEERETDAREPQRPTAVSPAKKASPSIPSGVWTNEPVQPANQSTTTDETNATEPSEQTDGQDPALPDATDKKAADAEDRNLEPPVIDSDKDLEKEELKIAARGMAGGFNISRSLEHNFGARLPVWIGGVAFALGGLFLVKYSIDNNLLSPLVRVLLGGLLGLGLLAGGDVVRKRPNFANGRRIAQSLSGAGVAVLYLAIYAATSLYELISPALGFVGLSGVTATAIVLSLRYGQPIALLGLIFGFVTPALVPSNEPSAVILFTYLIVLFGGAMLLIRQQNWWDLALPALGASLGWAVIWIFGARFGDDQVTVALFLLALAGLTAFFNQGHRPKITSEILPKFDQRTAFGYLGLCGSTFVMAAALKTSDYGLVEWGAFALLALGGIVLAYIEDLLYRFVPWVSMLTAAALLLSWQSNDLILYSAILVGFAALFAVSGYRLFWRADKALTWGGLSATAAFGFYLLAYYKLHLAPASEQVAIQSTFIWGGIALILSAIAIASVRAIQVHFSAEAQKEHLVAIFAVVATAFVSLTLVVVLDEKNLPLAFAAEVVAVAWIYFRTEIRVLRPVTGIVALVFAGLLVPQILLLVQLTAFSLVELQLPLQKSVPIVEEPLIRLGLPALFFAGAAIFLRRKADDRLVQALEVAAIALGTIMGYYVTRQVMNLDQNVLYVKAGFLERGIITNVLFLYGLFCFWVGRRYLRRAVFWSGAVLCGSALFRIGYFDLFLYNPIWSHQEILGWPVLNTLILPFGLPILWNLRAARELAWLGRDEAVPYWAQFLKPVSLLLAFVWITLMVRQAFQGNFLDSGTWENAEFYSYSVAWILLGIGLLVAGIVKRDQTLRYASLGVMLLAICKVFVVDAAALEGLYRVFSFFGLGLSLLGLSYVYTRFVFGGKAERPDREELAASTKDQP